MKRDQLVGNVTLDEKIYSKSKLEKFTLLVEF